MGAAASAYTSVPLDLDPKPLIVAEEMNTTTRLETFRNLVRSQNYDEILATAQAAGESRLAHARPMLRHRRRGREGIHHFCARENRHARSRADADRFD